MRLAEFILRDMEAILREWEAFAATQLPAAARMTPLALRDHAKQILAAVAKDLVNSPDEASSGRQIQGTSPETAGSTGNRGRDARRPAGAKAASTSTSWPPSTAPCAPASFACGWTPVRPTTVIWRMSSASTRPSIRRSPNRSAFSRPGGPVAQLVARDVGARHAQPAQHHPDDRLVLGGPERRGRRYRKRRPA